MWRTKLGSENQLEEQNMSAFPDVDFLTRSIVQYSIVYVYQHLKVSRAALTYTVMSG